MILIIDDNPVDLLMISTAMKKVRQEHVIKMFTGAAEALDYIKLYSHHIFLILCEMHLPGMTGADLLNAINRDADLRRCAIPFIFCSHSIRFGDVAKAYQLCAGGYFQKPDDFSKYTQLFKTIIDYWKGSRMPRMKIFDN